MAPRKRSLGVLVLILALAVSLPAAPVKLSLGAWGGVADTALYDQAIKQFKAANADIDVELVSTTDFLSFVQKLQTMLAGGVPPRWRNYLEVFTRVPFGRYFLNTVFVSAARVGGTVLTSAMAGYAFARLRFRGSTALFLVYLGTMACRRPSRRRP